MNKNSLSSLLIGSAILLSIAMVFGVGFISGRSTVSSSPLSVINKIDSSDASFAPYIQAWEIINKNYINQPVGKTLLIQGSIRGMLNSLGDPYTSYLDPVEFNAQNAPLEGEYTGIGAWVDVSGEALVIISPCQIHLQKKPVCSRVIKL